LVENANNNSFWRKFLHLQAKIMTKHVSITKYKVQIIGKQ